jgi:hypothetical protein
MRPIRTMTLGEAWHVLHERGYTLIGYCAVAHCTPLVQYYGRDARGREHSGWVDPFHIDTLRNLCEA